MQRLCKDPVNNGDICDELILAGLCQRNRNAQRSCKALPHTTGNITDVQYQAARIAAGLAGPAVPAQAAQDADARRRLAAAAAEARLGQAAAEARAAARAVQDAEVRRRLLAAAHAAPAHAAVAHAHASPAHAAVAHAAPVAAPVQPVKRCVGKVCSALLDACKWPLRGICYLSKKARDAAYYPYQNKTREIGYAREKANTVGMNSSIVLNASPIDIPDIPHTPVSATIHGLVANIRSNATLRAILRNEDVKNALLADIEQMESSPYKRNVIKVYELVTSKNFFSLLVDGGVADIGAANIDALRLSIQESIDEDGVFVIFNEVLSAMNRKFDDAANTLSQSTTTVYLSNANSERSKLLYDYLWEGINNVGFTTIGSILRNFGDFKMRVKDSASPTIMFTATLLPPNNSIRSLDIMRPPVQQEDSNIFFKVFPVGRFINPANRNQVVVPVNAAGHYVKYPVAGGRFSRMSHDSIGVEFEKNCYTELIKLEEYNVTPNILCTVATSNNLEEFNTFITSAELTDEFKTNAAEEIHKYYYGIPERESNFSSNQQFNFPPNLTFNEVEIIMTQMDGRPMQAEFDGLSPYERKSVMFQLIYNLYVFEQIQFSHGDLHMGNILVKTIPETTLCYIVYGIRFTFRTTKLVKMFDFDRGTICQTTPILYNRNQHFTINQILNPNRHPGEYFNTDLAETNVFNNKLDIVIFISHLRDTHGDPNNLSFFGATDPDFDTFCRNSFPGMLSGGGISGQTVENTIQLERMIPGNEPEFRRITGNLISVSDPIKDSTWGQYFDSISFANRKGGRIIKSEASVNNNHLWIPDTVVSSNLDMLENAYFASLRDPNPLAPIDNRRQIVYTIDNRI